jgi:hypothetical protein
MATTSRVYGHGRELIGTDAAVARVSARNLYERLRSYGCPESVARIAFRNQQAFEKRNAKAEPAKAAKRADDEKFRTEMTDKANKIRAAIIADEIAGYGL